MEIKTLLMYPPLQFQSGIVATPDGSLALPYLAGALRDADFEVSIFDASTGKDGEDLNESFFRETPLSSGLVRIGLPDAEILNRVEPYDVIGITSIFTSQATMALDTVEMINKAFPDKFILVGGVNARFMVDRFIGRGAHAVFHSESEGAIVDCVRALECNEPLEHVPGLSTRFGFTGIPKVVMNLDELPIPAWDLLPNEQYWNIGRPHGGGLG